MVYIAGSAVSLEGRDAGSIPRDLIPGLETPYATGSQKRKKRERERNSHTHKIN